MFISSARIWSWCKESVMWKPSWWWWRCLCLKLNLFGQNETFKDVSLTMWINNRNTVVSVTSASAEPSTAGSEPRRDPADDSQTQRSIITKPENEERSISGGKLLQRPQTDRTQQTTSAVFCPDCPVNCDLIGWTPAAGDSRWSPDWSDVSFSLLVFCS